MKRSLILLILTLFLSSFSFSQKKTFKREFYFEVNSSKLDSSELKKFTKYLKVLNKFNLKKIELIGCTDSDGSVKSNLILSNKRIETIQNLFLQKNYNTQINLKGLGEDNPKYENSKTEKYKNRRVEVIAFYKNRKGKKKGKSKKKEKNKKTIEIVKNQVLEIKEADLVAGNTINLSSVRFYGGTDEFLPGATETLDEVVKILLKNKTVKIEIAGHICCGNNMNLSINRAFKVYRFLKSNGISPKVLTYKGYNNTQPKYGNLMDIRNRRVELKVL